MTCCHASPVHQRLRDPACMCSCCESLVHDPASDAFCGCKENLLCFFSKVLLLSTQVTALFAASGNLLAMAPKAAIPKSDGNDAFPAHEARHDSS